MKYSVVISTGIKYTPIYYPFILTLNATYYAHSLEISTTRLASNLYSVNQRARAFPVQSVVQAVSLGRFC